MYERACSRESAGTRESGQGHQTDGDDAGVPRHLGVFGRAGAIKEVLVVSVPVRLELLPLVFQPWNFFLKISARVHLLIRRTLSTVLLRTFAGSARTSSGARG